MLVHITDVPRKHVNKMVKAASKHMSRNNDARVLDVQYWDMGTKECMVEISLARVSERYGEKLAKKILATYNEHPVIKKELAKEREKEEEAKRKEAWENFGRSPLARELTEQATEFFVSRVFLMMKRR